MRAAWIAAASVAVGWLAVVWCWQPSILTLTVDDSFYALETAIRASRGEGFTFDGIDRTDGFHPLWMWLLVAIARIGPHDVDRLVRVVLTVQIALVSLGAIALASWFPSRRRATWLALAVAFANFYLAKIVLNGLESALQFALLTFTVAWWARLERRGRETTSVTDAAFLGALCAATILARVTALVFAVTVLALATRKPFGARSRMVAWLVAMVPLAAWALAQYASFGHLVPVSAAIKWHMAQGPTVRSVALALAMVAGIVLVVRAIDRSPREPDEPRAALLLAPIALYAVVQALADVAVRRLLVPEIWYLVPELTLVVVAASALVGATTALRWAVCAVFAVATFASWQRRVRPDSCSAYRVAREAGLWLSRHAPPNAVVAGWDCGIVGAYAQRSVVPLDGLINSWTYKERYLDTHRVPEFLDERRVSFVAQALPARQLLQRSPRWDGVDLSSWHVAQTFCYAFRAADVSAPEPWIHLVVSRGGGGNELESERMELARACIRGLR